MRNVTVADVAKDELRLITEYLSTFGRSTAESFALEYDRKRQLLAEGTVEFPAARHPELARTRYRVAHVENHLMLCFPRKAVARVSGASKRSEAIGVCFLAAMSSRHRAHQPFGSLCYDSLCSWGGAAPTSNSVG